MNEERLMKIVLSPHVTEKSSVLAESARQFVFRVTSDATKQEIKKAVELMFDVQAKSVRVSNVKGKSKRTGTIRGKCSGWKKAYVTLKPGFDIDFMGPR